METIGFNLLNRKMAASYNAVTSSIAFYPIIITMCYLVLVVGMLYFDYSEAAKELGNDFAWMRFKEMEAVRAILTTLIAGIISLMALSFSMVMVVLSQATNTVSPKVMQGLVTRKEHQFVLGNQFGAILYFIILLLMLRAIDTYKLPTFSVSLGLLLGFWSLGLFVYFIHSISQSVQITNIVANIHKTTCRGLDQFKKQPPPVVNEQVEIDQTPYPFLTDKPGYLQQLNLKALMKVASKNDLRIRMEPYFTDFVPTGSILFRANIPPEKLSEKDRQLLYDSIIYFHTENVAINHVYGFTQLSEIAVKSLSPGINDPGIAVICIQYLSDLFVKLYSVEETRFHADDDNNVRLEVRKIGFEDLLHLTVRPIRHYGKQDVSVARALLGLFLVIGQADCQQQKFRSALNQHANAVLTGVKKALIVPSDAESLNSRLVKMLEIEPPYFDLQRMEAEKNQS